MEGATDREMAHRYAYLIGVLSDRKLGRAVLTKLDAIGARHDIGESEPREIAADIRGTAEQLDALVRRAG